MKNPLVPIIGAVIIAAGVTTGIWQTIPQSGGSPGTIFVGAAGSCTRNTSATTYNSATSCGSFNAANAIAQGGDTVYVESGAYPAQTISTANAASSGCDGYTIGASLANCVTFQPDSGATVSFTGEVHVDTSHIQLKNFSLGFTRIGECTDTVGTTGIVLTNDTAGGLSIADTTNDGILGGSYGPLHGNQIVFISNGTYDNCVSPGITTPLATHIRFDGVWFHDAIQDSAGQHLECLHSEPTDYLTIRNSKFTNCAQHDISLSQSPATHYLIENNVLANPCSEQSSPCGSNNPIDAGCSGGGAHSDWTVRFNSMNGAFVNGVSSSCSWTGTNLFYGNVENASWFDAFQCSTFNGYGWTSSYNINSSSTPCGSNSVVGSNQWVNASATTYNFHLLNCSVVAANLVPASVTGGVPSTDYAGTSRPSGANANLDAGAFEDC